MIEKILVRAPVSLKDDLRNVAQNRGLTLNALILEILWKYFEDKS